MNMEELRSSLAELSEQVRAERLERGLPAEPPPDFVGIPLSIALIRRLEPFQRIAVKYLAILAEGTIHRVDTNKLVQYREYAEVLSKSIGTFCGFIGGSTLALFTLMDEVTEEEDIDRAVHRGGIFAGWTRRDTESDIYEDQTDRAEIDRLCSDEEAFQAAYVAARAQYDEIKHLI